MRRRTGRIAALALAAAALAEAGCLGVLAVGAGVAGAVYFTGDEKASFPASGDQVLAATETALANLDIQLTASRRTPGGGASLRGVASAQRDLALEIDQKGEQLSEVDVRVGTLGDEAESQRILGEIGRVLEAPPEE